MANQGDKVLTVEEEQALLRPIDERVSAIQAKIDELRRDGTDRVVKLQGDIDATKRDRILTKEEREQAIAGYKSELAAAKAVEASHKVEVAGLVSEAEGYLKEHYAKEYLEPVRESCAQERMLAKDRYQANLKALEDEHRANLSGLTDRAEVKDENYVYKNRRFDAKVVFEKEMQQIKDREHAAFSYEYHLIDLLRMSKFTFAQRQAQKWENYKYTFDRINAFVNAYKPVNDITVACGAGAIKLGFPVITNDHDDMWAVPKSLIIYDDTKDWIDTSIEARGIKLKITKIDIPVSFSSAFEGEIIRKGDMQVEIDGSRKDCFELVTTKDASEVEDHKIEVVGPEIDEIPVGSKISMSYTVEVAGKAMQPDFEPVFERKIHSFLNCVEGLMHTGQRDMIRVRISKADFEAGFKFKHIGEVLYAKIKSEFDTVVDKCQVRIVVGDEPNAELRKHANEVFDKRDERLKSMTD